jgi:hypothetical protein
LQLSANIFWSVVSGMVGISFFGQFQNNSEEPAMRNGEFA